MKPMKLLGFVLDFLLGGFGLAFFLVQVVLPFALLYFLVSFACGCACGCEEPRFANAQVVDKSACVADGNLVRCTVVTTTGNTVNYKAHNGYPLIQGKKICCYDRCELYKPCS